MTSLEILELPMASNDADAATVREYLKALLSTLWEEGEGFSGKRPFGNSGWSYDLAVPLVKAGVINGALDEDGFIEKCDDKQLDDAIKGAIEAL